MKKMFYKFKVNTASKVWIIGIIMVILILSINIATATLTERISDNQISLINIVDTIIDTQTILIDNMAKVDEDIKGIIETQRREIGVFVDVILELENRIEKLENMVEK